MDAPAPAHLDDGETAAARVEALTAELSVLEARRAERETAAGGARSEEAQTLLASLLDFEQSTIALTAEVRAQERRTRLLGKTLWTSPFGFAFRRFYVGGLGAICALWVWGELGGEWGVAAFGAFPTAMALGRWWAGRERAQP